MPVWEVSESKPLARVHAPRVHARAACDHPIPNQNKKYSKCQCGKCLRASLLEEFTYQAAEFMQANSNSKINIKQMPVCEVSESKPLGRVHVPSCRVHARAVYRAIQFKNKRIANARFGRVRSQVHR